MASFYFHFRDGGPEELDEEGCEFDTVRLASEAAWDALAVMAREMGPPPSSHEIAVSVCDHTGSEVWRAAMSLAIAQATGRLPH
ncbi:hypothetical protein [Jiella sp. M17.18]|uniref:DUF6894 family protein n=1 Tax=Jiella sp. M17.18 TaxID=3234247 RepID=UPI0034E0160C